MLYAEKCHALTYSVCCLEKRLQGKMQRYHVDAVVIVQVRDCGGWAQDVSIRGDLKSYRVSGFFWIVGPRVRKDQG